ncbi:MAG: peptidylprolyl isomerase [Verrucomicrobia bacterium]|nr:peptidylprolyl isomerase [Verrucomicrobiota bacterium]MDE3098151.1 peptidylprolyl isomerase [Verrucomicrobiota bacterium]
MAAVSAICTLSAAAVTAPALAPAPAGSGPASNSPDAVASLFGNPVIAAGKGFQIKQSDLDQVTEGVRAEAAAHDQTITPDQMTAINARVLQGLIEDNLLLQKATGGDRAQAQAETKWQMADLLKRAGSEADLDLELRALGMNQDQLRTKIETKMTAMAVLQRELGVKITDADARAYYTNHASDFVQPETVQVRHILFLTVDTATHQPLSDKDKKAKYAQARKVLKEAQAGTDFAKLAGQYSEDTSTRSNGGQLPPFDGQGNIIGAPGQRMVPAFTQAAFSLTNTDQISGIVTSPYGYHIIQLEKRTPSSTVAYNTIADRLKYVLVQQKMSPLAPPYLEKLNKGADVKILDPALKEAVAALMTNQPPQMAAPSQ